MPCGKPTGTSRTSSPGSRRLRPRPSTAPSSSSPRRSASPASSFSSSCPRRRRYFLTFSVSTQRDEDSRTARSAKEASGLRRLSGCKCSPLSLRLEVRRRRRVSEHLALATDEPALAPFLSSLEPRLFPAPVTRLPCPFSLVLPYSWLYLYLTKLVFHSAHTRLTRRACHALPSPPPRLAPLALDHHRCANGHVR